MATGQTREEEVIEVLHAMRKERDDLRAKLHELNEENTRLYAENARLRAQLADAHWDLVP